MPKMRAKVEVQSVLIGKYPGDSLVFTGVCGGSPEDNSFCTATPQLDLKMYINNPELLGQIKPGQKFYLDFTLAE